MTQNAQDTDGGESQSQEKDTRTLPTTENPSPARSISKPHDSKWQSFKRNIHAEISLDHADLPLIASSFVSGLCDSSAYNAWTCFVSMQTGNTIFLALGASGQPLIHPYGWTKSFISIISFLCGCAFFASSRYIGPKSKGTLAGSFFIQGVCVVIAAALVQSHVVPEPHGRISEVANVNFIELIPLAFLAFQSGGQIVTSRILGFNEIPTTVLTSVYCDLASDTRFFAKDNVKRNRRLGTVLAILTGGISGGWLSRSKAGMSTALWIAAAIKLGISASWSVWKPKTTLQV